MKKKIISALLFVSIAFNNILATNDGYVTFDDIHFDKPANELIDLFLQSNFYENPYDHSLSGIISPFGECIIELTEGTESDTLLRIAFPECTDWETLSNTYFSIKDKLKSKYKITDYIEAFSSIPQPKSNEDKLWEAKFERCNFRTIFLTGNGIITLSISSIDLGCHVTITIPANEACLQHFEENNQPKTNDDNETITNQISVPIQENTTRYKLYPTQNMWTFLKLDTQTGKIWQVQYDIKDNNRFETAVNLTNLSPIFEQPINDRFELYPTQNIYNFILLDKINGATWQVQWSIDNDKRFIIPISY